MLWIFLEDCLTQSTNEAMQLLGASESLTYRTLLLTCLCLYRIGAASKSVIRLLPASAAQLLKEMHQAFQAVPSRDMTSRQAHKQEAVALGETAMQFASIAFKVKNHSTSVSELLPTCSSEDGGRIR